ncbi:hypothetical protein [Kibdelosporangium phytohabitans]|uniref:Uncharacterized protein n=1 Tax=Kibdelosporangium phytohabitans TaxID=860235 RepID=A0A0N9IDI0_9PSEU|nr:hypothetical protein [Kibdelosporangium phytohabitans]ALG12809.1 hypothetical protein AOZ06_43455 [Kibdelosporangium phytohabitans]MBE1464495.1 hypothetical protein [Kibdelosporangium phytohabitans]
MTLIDRIERTTGVPGLPGLLADLAPADLRSLLLDVHRRQAAKRTPAQVLAQYKRDRFTGVATVDPVSQAEYDLFAFKTLRDRGYTPVELSPVSPLGTVSVLSGTDQNRVVTTARGSEVMADSTNALALESAVRRSGRQPVRLCASHRLLRAQPFPQGWSSHFRLLALTVAGRDEGSFRFETGSLCAQLSAMVALIEHLADVQVLVTVLDESRRDAVAERVIERLRGESPQVKVGFDDERQKGRGYYVDACFELRAGDVSLADGGFTTWTRQLLGNAKERLLTGGLGVDLMHARFGPRRADLYS